MKLICFGTSYSLYLDLLIIIFEIMYQVPKRKQILLYLYNVCVLVILLYWQVSRNDNYTTIIYGYKFIISL